MKTSAERNLEEIPKDKKKPYISKETRHLIEERNDKHKKGATETEIKQLTRNISKAAAKDKQEYLIEQFNENPKDNNKKELWKSVKGLKRKFVPEYIKINSKEGNYVPLTKRAEAIADYS